MSPKKSIFVALLLTAAVCLVPHAQATITIESTTVGSSGAWQAFGVGTYNYCVKTYGAGNCFHWTSASNVVNLTDTRVTPNNNDLGTSWIVWEAVSGTVEKLWSDTKVDSIVGNRCFFAQPHCNVNATAANLSGSGAGKISTSLWGADTALPATIQSIFETATLVNAVLTDIRPDDAAFENCRVNSSLGAGSYGGAASDGLDGLGYNTNNASGVCAAAGGTQANYVGTPIQSAYPGVPATDVANVLAYNYTGSDPITGTAIPANTVVELGADPVIFFFERNIGQLSGLKDVTVSQLQQAFSGTNCDASAFGLAPGAIGIFLREPESGTMTTLELTTFRGQTLYNGSGGGGILGISQEANVGNNNPLNAQAGTCVAGSGRRYRGIGTSDEQNWVLNSGANLGFDGIGYQFFSYGNVSPYKNNPNYGYATLDGVDPIYTSYGNQVKTGAPLDPGQPTTAGTMPGSGNVCGGAGFPCSEKSIYASGLSFPNVRNGSYKAWSIIRAVAYNTGTTLAALKNQVKGAQVSLVDDEPDFVPAVKTVGVSETDPGLTILRSHLQQYDGAGTFIGLAPVNKTDAGADAGGLVLPTTGTTSTTTEQLEGFQGQQGR